MELRPIVLLVALACAPHETATPTAAEGAAAPCDPQRDRAAILAMAGEYRVAFAFEETEVLAPGYTRHEPYRTGAREVVEVIAESPTAVSLQHVLVLPGEDGEATAMRHWRQDWTFEDRELLEFRGRDTWAHRELPADEVRCTWSQAVYGVVDEPRYESVGRWVHEDERSTWTSAQTWRPLPRREHTKRDDYDVLVATNRHVVTQGGWIHEQDNEKLVLATGVRLVRERGVNRYDRTTLPDAAVARAYVHDTEPLWQAVRAAWTQSLAAHERLVVRPPGGIPLHEQLFPLAEGDDDDLAQRQARATAIVRAAVVPAQRVTAARR